MKTAGKQELIRLGYVLVCDDSEKEMYERPAMSGGTDTVCFHRKTHEISAGFCDLEDECDFSDEAEAIMEAACEMGWAEPLDGMERHEK